MFAFDNPVVFEFQQEKVLRLAEQHAGAVRILERQLVNFGAPEIAIYLRKYLCAHSALVLNSSETSGSLSNSGALTMCS